jgi:hypothetical protein
VSTLKGRGSGGRLTSKEQVMKRLAFITGLAALAGSAAAAVSGSGLVVLNQTASGALRMTGQSAVRVPAHAVYVNSSSSSAISAQGQAIIDSPNVYVVGGYNGSTNQGGTPSWCTGQVHCGGAPYQNPCAGLAFPTSYNMQTFAAVSINGGGNFTLQPGYYPSGISVTGNATVLFNPGTYVIGGTGLRITSGNVSGYGVCFVMESGAFDIAGGSSFIFTPPGSGTLQDYVFVQPASNTNMLKFAGGSTTLVTGTIYAPNATVRLVGNSTLEGEGPQWGDLVVADKVELTGTSLIKIGRENLQALVLPKLPLFD